MPLTDNSDSLVTRNLTVEDSLELGADTSVEFKEMAAPGTPATGSLVAYAKTDGKLYIKNDAGAELDLTAGAGGGEANTASNIGTAGVGLFKSKVGVDLQFKKLNAGSAKITLTDDVANNEVDVDLGSVASTDLSDGADLYKTGGTDVAVADGGTGASTKTLGFNNLAPATTKGDLMVHDGTDSVRQAVGTDGQFLKADSGAAAGVSWDTPAGSGDVSGPASSTDNAVARFDGTGGKTLQNGAVTIDDSGNVAGVGNITLSGTLDGRDVSTDGTKLDGIENSADVTDEANVTAAHPISDETELVKDPTDGTKRMRIDVGNVATSTTRLLTVPDQDVDLTPGTGTFAAASHTHTATDITSGTLSGDRLPAKNKTVTKIIYIEDPTATDSFPMGYVPNAAAMVAVRAVTDTGTVDFNIEKRAKLTPDVAGTDIWTADKQATAAGLEQTGFDSGSIGADEWLHFSASAVAGAPTKLWVSLEYTID